MTETANVLLGKVSLPVENIGNYTLGSEHIHQILLAKAVSFHIGVGQMASGLASGSGKFLAL
jgi:hypothetical protein